MRIQPPRLGWESLVSSLVRRFVKSLRLVAACALTGLCAVGAYAADDISAAHRKKISEFMDVIGLENISRQVSMSVAKQLALGLKQAQPDIDPKAFEIVLSISNEVLDARSDELLKKMVPLFAKRFTEAELDELLAFYRSPIGRKTTEAMPALMQESMELAATEAQSSVPEIKEKVSERLRKDGLIEKP